MAGSQVGCSWTRKKSLRNDRFQVFSVYWHSITVAIVNGKRLLMFERISQVRWGKRLARVDSRSGDDVCVGTEERVSG